MKHAGHALAGLCLVILGPAALPALAAAAGLELQSGALRISVTPIADDILRVRVAAGGEFPEDASWVVPAEVRHASVRLQDWSDEQAAGFRTALLAVRVERASLRLVVSTLDGKVISADVPGDVPGRAIESRGTAFTLRKLMPEAEHYFGLGDKTGPLDRRGQAFVNWNTDAYRFQESTDPLYKSVPFFLASGGPGGSYGIYLDNTWRSWFDFGKRDRDTLAFGADGGPIDYYLVYGPSPRRVVERFTSLSGRPPLPPLWSLGFQQSRYSYMSAGEVRAVAARLRSLRIPADVIWLDIDFQDRNRPFTTNSATFPDFPDLARTLRQQNFRLIAITDLHIADAPGQGYAPYDSGMAGDHFLKRADGTPYVGKVWPGPALFPDFTRASTREWWGSLYRPLLKAGIAGFWNDMNEPAIFETLSKTMPLDNVHRIEEAGFATRSATHAELHNVYGMENSRATFEGLRRFAPDERAYVMTRASFAGGQRYAVTWTGDNSSTWNHLKLSVGMLLNLGLSGFAYSGADVGGYAGAPSPELLTRWIELATFMPVFRDHYDHSDKGSASREPWVDGPRHTEIRRRFIAERYHLLPYLYALADENSRSGAPLMRPVFYEFPAALASSCEQPTLFMLGDQLLVTAGADLESPAPYPVCLPAGRWYDYWTGAELRSLPRAAAAAANPANPAGPSELVITATPALDRLPVFVRGGTILPRQPPVQSTAETPRGPLSLDVYPGEDCHGRIYLDDGHSMAYVRGEFLRQALRCELREDGLVIGFERREGSYRPWWRELQVTVHGWQGAATATIDDRPVAVSLAAPQQEARVLLDDQPAPARLVIRHPVRQ